MEQLFAAIPAVVKALEMNSHCDEAVVFAAWSRCAGELLRGRTAPLKFSDNRLVVAVEDASWQRHLENLSPQMLASINRSTGQGTVKLIEFCVDKSAVGRKQDHARATVEYGPGDVSPSLCSAAEAISDENLREQFLNAAASYLAKQELVRNPTFLQIRNS